MLEAKYFKEKYAIKINIDNILNEIEKQIAEHCEKYGDKYCSIQFKINSHCHDDVSKEVIRRKLIDLGYNVSESEVCEGFGMGEHYIPCWEISW